MCFGGVFISVQGVSCDREWKREWEQSDNGWEIGYTVGRLTFHRLMLRSREPVPSLDIGHGERVCTAVGGDVGAEGAEDIEEHDLDQQEPSDTEVHTVY